MIKIKVALQDFGSVEAHNLDDLFSHDLWMAIIPRMKDIDHGSLSAMFLFTSPQYIDNHSIIINAILQCHVLKTLQLIAVNEAHILAMHEHTFGAMRILRDIKLIRAQVKSHFLIFNVGKAHLK